MFFETVVKRCSFVCLVLEVRRDTFRFLSFYLAEIYVYFLK